MSDKKGPDMELRKAFVELQVRFLDLTKKVQISQKRHFFVKPFEHVFFFQLFFNFFQTKMVDNKQKMRMADLQIENLKRSITHSELTSAELKSLPQETRLYESVGRMFLLSSHSEVSGMLTKKQDNCKEKIKNLEANKTYLERSMKDSENSLRELVAQKKAQ